LGRSRQRIRDHGEGDDSSRRQCALTRASLDPDELIRFVAAPSGDIVPDLNRKLPGRGVWVTCEKSVVTAAMRANAFSKALKRPVKFPDDLEEQTERLLLRRAGEAFALANKAGLVTTGFSQVQSVIGDGTAVALVHAAEAASGGRVKLDRKFAAIAREKGRNARIVTVLSTEELSLAIGRSNVVHAALIQGGATKRFLNEAQRLERYRAGSSASAGAAGTAELEV
jgi:uncharacterized protein